MNNVDMASVREPSLPSYEVSQDIESLTARAFFAGSIRGVGQVYLANSIASGVLVLIGIFICSRIQGFAAFFGSIIGAGVAAFVGSSASAIENGMYGFNPSLTMSAMLMFYVPSFGSTSIGILASVITVFIQLALATSLEPCGLPFMTLPFCFAALAFIVIQGTTSNVISVPLSSMTTPEDHLERVRRLSSGFELLYGAIRSASYSGEQRKSWKSIVGYNSESRKMSSVLEEYDDEVHGDGDSKKGFFARIFRKTNDEPHPDDNGGMQRTQSFRMSFAMNNPVFDDKEKESYARIFNHIDAEKEYEVNTQQFEAFLRSVGFRDPVGLEFACEAFQLMDLDKSGDVDLDEFIAFCKISNHMPVIRRLIVKFFDFVDADGSQTVEIQEFDSALSYLGLPPLAKDDRDSLSALANGEGELEFEVIVNFVTVFKLKSIIKEYQGNRKGGQSLDESVHSAMGLKTKS